MLALGRARHFCWESTPGLVIATAPNCDDDHGSRARSDRRGLAPQHHCPQGPGRAARWHGGGSTSGREAMDDAMDFVGVISFCLGRDFPPQAQ